MGLKDIIDSLSTIFDRWVIEDVVDNKDIPDVMEVIISVDCKNGLHLCIDVGDLRKACNAFHELKKVTSLDETWVKDIVREEIAEMVHRMAHDG